MRKRDILPEEDDRTVSDMSADWMPWNHVGPFKFRARRRSRRKGEESVSFDKKERRAAIRGQYLAMLPMLLCVLLAFGFMFLLFYFWLRP